MALSPSLRKNIEYRSISDVYDEIIRLYDKAQDKGFNVGEAIYKQSFFFSDHETLLNSDMQNRIKEFQFCKKFNCPPCSNLQDTPAIIVDDFFIIDEEFNHYLERKKDA